MYLGNVYNKQINQIEIYEAYDNSVMIFLIKNLKYFELLF